MASVAEMFRVVLNIGRSAPVRVVANIAADLDAVAQGAVNVAVHEAQAQADRHISALLREGGMRRLMLEGRRWELPAALGEEGTELERFEDELEDLYLRRSSPRARLLWPLLLAGVGLPYSPQSSNLVEQLRSHEIETRLPDEPYRLRSLRYQNPLTVEIISAGAAATTALAVLLGIIRDWTPRRRQALAAAADAEDQAWTRAQLRRFLLHQVSRGELAIPPEVISDLVNGDLAQATDRLALYAPRIRRTEIPDDGEQ